MNRYGVGLRPRPGAGTLLTLALLAALLVTLRSAGAAVSSREFEVATLSEDQWSPAIKGDVVVWEDQRNSSSDVFARDLGSGQEFPVSTSPGSQQEPGIGGDTIVWEDDRNGNWDVYGYDLDTGNEFRITTDPADQRKPAVSDGTVVWEDHRAGNWDIYGKDLGTGDGFRITTDAADQRRPDISGGTVVWEDRRGADSDIYGEDLKDGREFRVTEDPAWQDMPATGGDTVVWRDARNAGHYDVYGKDLSENEEFRITTDASDQVSPDVSGRVAVWADGRDGNADIYGKDLSTGEVFRVTSDSGPQESPAIDGESVVWESQRTGETNFGTYDIHGSELDLAPAPPADLRAEGSRSGVSLGWNANTEDDLVGYNVYRSDASEGSYDKLNAGLLTAPSYSDENAPRGSVSHYRVTAVDEAGNESAPATANAAALAPSEIGLKAEPVRLKFGRVTTLSGRLTWNGKALSGERVILLQRPVGNKRFSPVPRGRLTTARDGSFRLGGVKPGKSTVYRASFAGDPEAGLGSSISASERVSVRATVSLRLSTSKPKPGKRVIISGRVRPAHRGPVRVVIRGSGRRVAGGEVSLRKVRSARAVSLRNSRYRLAYKPPKAGRYRVRVSLARHADHLGGRSPVRKFRVVR